MTVPEKHQRKRIAAAGFVNPLTHDVYLESASHLKVFADDVQLVLGVDYTVGSLLDAAGYTVSIAVPDPGSEPSWWGPEYFILSVEPPIEQASDVSLGGQFGQRYETALDALTRRVQHLADETLRAVKMPRTTSTSVELEVPAAQDGYVLGWNGTELASMPPSVVSPTEYATLSSLSGLSLEAGDMIYATAAETLARLPKGAATQVLTMNAGATAPEWANTNRASPRMFGTVGAGADDQAIFNEWFAYFLAGNPVILDCELRLSDASIAHPGILTATGDLDMVATPAGKFTYVGGSWIYRLIAVDLDGFNCFADFGFVDGNDLVGKGVHLSNGAGNPQTNTVEVSCTGKDFRVLASGLNGYQCGVMSFSGGCEHLIVNKWHGENLSAAAGNLDSLQMFVISADEANGLFPKHIRVKDYSAHNVKADDYITRASSDADGLVIFGHTEQVEGSCVIENAKTSEICGRGLKLAHKFAVVKFQSDYRSIQGHTITAAVGATSCAFQYGTGVHENLQAVFEGADVFNKNADVLINFSSQSDVDPSVRAVREVGSVSVTCKDTGVTNGLYKLVDFRGGHTMTDDTEYVSTLKSATMSGGFTKYAVGVESSGFSGRPQTVRASNVKANISTAFAVADANMAVGSFVMHIENITNVGSTIPVIARSDAVDMTGVIGEIVGGGIIRGIHRSRGITWTGITAGYAPQGSKFRSPVSSRTSFTSARIPLFDETTISSASGTLSTPCVFPCEIQVQTVYGAAMGRFAVANTGAITQIYNTNSTHLQGNGLSEPATGTYRLWTTYDYTSMGGTVYFKTTDGTSRYFEVVADV